MALYIDRLKGLSVPARLIAVNVAVFVLLHLTVLILKDRKSTRLNSSH